MPETAEEHLRHAIQYLEELERHLTLALRKLVAEREQQEREEREERDSRVVVRR